MSDDGTDFLLGIDLGACRIKIALYSPEGDFLRGAQAEGRGRPAHSLLQLLESFPVPPAPARGIKLGVCGSGQSLLWGLLPCLPVNEILASALAVRRLFPAARTIIDLGGQNSKWILLGADAAQADAVVDFATNGLCAAGGGAFLEQQAHRLALSVDELGHMAAGAPRGAAVAGRCSVFAKSDMIHLQQKGTPLEEIALGLCQALVHTFLNTILQGRRIEPPVALVGGGALNPGLARAFREALELPADQLIVPADPLLSAAQGAARLAADAPATTWETLLTVLRQESAHRARSGLLPRKALPALSSDCAARSVAQPPEDPPAAGGVIRAYLGIDVGSVSTNLALLSPEFVLLQGIYLPTRGRPMEVLQEGLGLIRERYEGRLEVLGSGTTGSGRHVAAKLLGADVVRNEITAQMVSAHFFFPQADTIFEIGGQDSKFISVRAGMLADFEMNKICAGGTGSFLEEQAQRLGVRIAGEFSDLAFLAQHPCDLGTRCTVFMDTELVRAMEQGVALEDICAGLAYSVARNYLEKVVAGRPIGRCVVFQGGTASNGAVAAAFRQLLKRPVHVHPYNRISGAIGAALLAARAQAGRSQFLGLRACSQYQLRSFECPRCENRCQVNRVQMRDRHVHFGDVCERYSERDRKVERPVRPFAELFAARGQLLEQFIDASTPCPSGRPRMGLLRASLNMEFLPFWSAFLRELSYQPVISQSTTPQLLREHSRGMPEELCLPIKTAAAQARALLASGAVDKVFVPTLLECPRRGKDEPSHTCFYAQQLADMSRVELKSGVVCAKFAVGDGILGLLEPLLELAQALDRSPDAVLRAFARSRGVQAQWEARRKQLGREALAAPFDRCAVILGRPYNTHDPYLNLSVARRLERLGLPAIPWDLLPLDEAHLDPRWQSVPWHFSREQLRVVELMRRDPRLFPILLSSYGCGPDGFTMKHIEELLAGRPRLFLEFDEHRGEAGLVTRLEAFADEMDEHIRRRIMDSGDVKATPGPRPLPAGRRFLVPHFSEHANIFAAVLNSVGVEAHVLPIPDAETVRLGEENASGRECHPYTILSGELLRLAGDSPIREGDVFFYPNCTAPCLLQQYGDAHRILLKRMGLGRVEIWEATMARFGSLVGIAGLVRLYEGLLSTDVLMVLAARLRPYEVRQGAVNQVLELSLAKLARAIKNHERLDALLAQAAGELWAMPRAGKPGSRPLVGITGDLYTRMNPVGNADLCRRLEEMGCEVWLSPFFADGTLLTAEPELYRQAERGRLRQAALSGLSLALTGRSRRRLLSGLPEEIATLAVEPPAEELLKLASPYVAPNTNHLIMLAVAKMADFLHRGAMGVINAGGINCMVTTAASSAVPALRADYGQAPIITLFYGGTEGPSQRIRLETFVHQVKRRWSRHAA